MAKAKILILGAKGMLGQEFVKIFKQQAIGWDREDFDITKISKYKAKIAALKPWAIINCVAYNNVDKAENDQQTCFAVNANAVGELAKLCEQLGVPLVHFSTNYVFDGKKGQYTEKDIPKPLSVYGKSKLQGEKLLQKFCDKFYLVRTAVLFGKRGSSSETKTSFVELMLEKADRGESVQAVSDLINSLTYAVDLAPKVKLLLEQQTEFGIYHITNAGQASWYDFAKEIFKLTGKTKLKLVPVSFKNFPRKAVVPKKAVLLSKKLKPLRSWQAALKEFLIKNKVL